MLILGVYGGGTLGQHDPGAVLVCDGRVLAACEEERFLRIKSPVGCMPIESIRACLRIGAVELADIDLLTHPGETYFDMPDRIRTYLQHYFGCAPPIRMINHHLAHLASAFFCSGYERAMCLSYDAYGDKLSAALGLGSPKGVQILETRSRDNSLGMFYATMTSYLGFTAGEDEYKIMGLAPYGGPGIDLSPFATPTEDGYLVNTTFIMPDYAIRTSLEPLYAPELIELLGAARKPHEPITSRHFDIAYATQTTLEACAASLVRHLAARTGLESLCLAGGIALNCSANQILRQLPGITRLFIQPAASDRGLALGCALQAAFERGDAPQPLDDVFLGLDYEETDVRRVLTLTHTRYSECADPTIEAAQLLGAGKIIGWFQGRSEFGPRALGNRSILADPRQPGMKEMLNTRVKFREDFRPFAPSVLEERANDLFEIEEPSPYMTVSYRVRSEWRERIPAVTHVNGTARVQTVDRRRTPLFHRLIEAFCRHTGVPAVLNTSLNVRGQPIVETPNDALATFASTGLDALFLGRFKVLK